MNTAEFLDAYLAHLEPQRVLPESVKDELEAYVDALPWEIIGNVLGEERPDLTLYHLRTKHQHTLEELQHHYVALVTMHTAGERIRSERFPDYTRIQGLTNRAVNGDLKPESITAVMQFSALQGFLWWTHNAALSIDITSRLARHAHKPDEGAELEEFEQVLGDAMLIPGPENTTRALQAMRDNITSGNSSVVANRLHQYVNDVYAIVNGAEALAQHMVHRAARYRNHLSERTENSNTALHFSFGLGLQRCYEGIMAVEDALRHPA